MTGDSSRTIRLSRPHCCACDATICHHIGVILCDAHRLGRAPRVGHSPP